MNRNFSIFSLFLSLRIILALIFIFSVIFFGLNYSGFCFSKMHYLNNQEKIKAVFEQHNNRNTIPVETEKETRFYQYVKYENFDKYVKENPNCCVVNPGGPYDVAPPQLLDRIFGFNSTDVVVINFKARYIDDNGKQKIKQYKIEQAVQNCGQPR